MFCCLQVQPSTRQYVCVYVCTCVCVYNNVVSVCAVGVDLCSVVYRYQTVCVCVHVCVCV